MSAVQIAANEAFDMQMYDDNRAQSVAYIFIEDAMKANRIPSIHFGKVEASADKMWSLYSRKRKSSRRLKAP